MMPGRGFRRDTIILDPLFFIELLLLGLFPISLIAILQQSNAGLVAKTALIIVFGIVGFVANLTLGAVKQQRIRFLSFGELWKHGTFLIVLMLVGVTYASQFFISAGAGISGSVLGIADVVQSKTYYASIGVWEELAFGCGLLVTLDNLFDNIYWTGFNAFVLNPILFGVYHIFVIGPSIALLYVIVPRIMFNVWYVFAAQPSPVMLAHWCWNFVISSVGASGVALSVAGLTFSVPQLSLLSCLPTIGLILWKELM